MKNRITLGIICTLVLFSSACKKEENNVSVKELLAAKTWKSTALVSDGVPSSAWCWLNSLYDFTPSGNLYITQGDDMGACSGDPIGTITGIPFKISDDENRLILVRSFPSSADTFEIVSISDQLLKTRRVVNKSTPSPNVWEDTFTAQ